MPALWMEILTSEKEGEGMITSEHFELNEEEARGLAAIVTALDEREVNFNTIELSMVADDTVDFVVTIRGVRK